MKKLMVILLVALFVSCIIMGCQSNTQPAQPAPNEPAEASVITPAPADDETTTPVNESEPEPQAITAQPEKSNFALGHLNSTAHLLGFVAQEEGFFKEEGLDVAVTLFASAGEMVAGLEGGQLDAAFIGSIPTITNQAAGHDITVFGGAMTNGHGYVIKTELVPDSFTQGDITVLTGHSVASVKNSIQDYELLVLLDKAGLSIGEGDGEVDVVYFESQKDAYNALAGNEIDAVSVYSPYASVARAAGHTVIYYCNEVEEFKDQPCCRQVALTESLSQYPNMYIAFERALIKAFKFTQENREKTIDDVAKYITIEKEQIEYEVYGGHAHSVPDPDKKATTTLKHGAVDFGYTGGVDYDIDTLYNTQLYKAALDQLIALYPGDGVYQELLTHFNTAD